MAGYYDRVHASAQVVPARSVGPSNAGAEPDKLRRYVTVASGQDPRFAPLASIVTLDGVTATVTFLRSLNAAERQRYREAGWPPYEIDVAQVEETNPVRPAELITLPDVASLVRPLVADSASVSEFTTGVATAFENADQQLLDLLATYPGLAAYIVPGFAPGRSSGESSLAIALAYFDKFDIAAHGGDPDGKISTSDLEAIRNDLSLPEYVRDAAGRLLDSPTLLHMAVGGGEFLTRDGITTFVEMNQRVRTIDQHFVRFDTAAKSGEPDGFVSIADLEAAAGNQSLPTDVRQAAQWMLDHPEQLGLLTGYSQIKQLGSIPIPIPNWYPGFKRQDLIGRIVDGQAYGDDPEAAERFVNSLPVADDGHPGLPIWLCSTDGVKALANAALIGTDGDLTDQQSDLTDQQSVIAHLPETKDAIRNELITAYYDMLAQRADKVFAGDLAGNPARPGHPGANWLIYAPWASNGVHEVINGKFSALGVNPSMDDRQNAADGNQWIFNDNAARFTTFIELYENNSYNPSTAQLETFFRDNFHDGDAEIRNAFSAYAAVTRETDPVRRQALMFQGNTLVATHEQAGAQPYLESIGEWYIPDNVEAEFIDVRMGEYVIEVNKDVPRVVGTNNHVEGMRILDLDTGGKRPADFSRPDLTFVPVGGPAGPDVIRLDNISGIQGFPTSTTTWHREGAKVYEAVLVPGIPDLVPQQVVPDPDGLSGSAATAWTDPNERMWAILKLFEQTHTNRSLYNTDSLDQSFGDYDWLEPNARPTR